MKVLFLDHQGVMRLKPHPQPGVLMDFDRDCVKALNEIIESTDVEIVVSSDWKYWVPIEEMARFYLEQGVIKVPAGYTQKRTVFGNSSMESERAFEIREWLSGHPETKCWAWVDDLDMRPFIGNSAWTGEGGGIISVSEKIISFFESCGVYGVKY